MLCATPPLGAVRATGTRDTLTDPQNGARVMFGRYRKQVPKDQRDLIKYQRLPKPNWFVGSAERSFTPDAALQAEIGRLIARLEARRRSDA